MQSKSVDNLLISIIVPVYNVQNYLSYTVDSIISQTYSNWELLLVDDGSTDFSPLICEDYSRKDKRIKFFRTENGGVSRARNYGIERVQGDYIVFCDSDDLVSPNFLERLMQVQTETNADVVSCSVLNIDESCDKYIPSPSNSVITTYSVDTFNKIPETFFYVVWGKLYKRSLFFDENYRFEESLNRGEDTLFALQTLLVSKVIVEIDDKLINYRLRSNSLMHSNPSNSLYLQSKFRAMKIKEWETLYSESSIIKQIKEIISIQLFLDMINSCNDSSKLKNLIDDFKNSGDIYDMVLNNETRFSNKPKFLLYIIVHLPSLLSSKLLKIIL